MAIDRALELDISRVPATPGAETLMAFCRHRLAMAGLFGLVALTVLSMLGPSVVGHDPAATDIQAIYAAPSSSHLLGTDQLGRDLLARLLYGGRVSLLVGLMATLLATMIGCTYGILSGMLPKWFEYPMMQLLDALHAIPVILLVIVSDVFGESSLMKMVLVIGLASWMGIARMARTECRRLMEIDFVKGAIMAGASPLRLVFRHLLPNMFAPLIVVITVGVGQAILLESTLSFLNMGVPATVPSWGNLLGNGMSSVLGGAWWIVVFPGLMIVLTVLSMNLVGDGLRDLIDPKNRRIC
ncbi:MAG: ABC transporter permease [Nitrospiraceae bacterium]